jgi:hypothetical protein
MSTAPVTSQDKHAATGGGAPLALQKELSVYNAHLLELLQNEGKYVAICGEEIRGPFGSYDEALDDGYKTFGLVPFLVKQITQAEPICYFSRDLPICRS